MGSRPYSLFFLSCPGVWERGGSQKLEELPGVGGLQASGNLSCQRSPDLHPSPVPYPASAQKGNHPLKGLPESSTLVV